MKLNAITLYDSVPHRMFQMFNLSTYLSAFMGIISQCTHIGDFRFRSNYSVNVNVLTRQMKFIITFIRFDIFDLMHDEN